MQNNAASQKLLDPFWLYIAEVVMPPGAEYRPLDEPRIGSAAEGRDA